MKKTAKYIEDEPKPVSYSKLRTSLQDIHAYRILFGIVRTYWLDNYKSLNFSPVAKEILNNLPLLSFIPAFLQLWTLCRFNELKQIRISDIKKMNEFVINSSKSDHQRKVKAIPFEKGADLRKIKDKTKILVVSYDSYKNSIISTKSNIGISLGENFLDCTHIFRHLEASFMFSQNLGLDSISYSLGHQNEKTSFEYIHKDWRF